MAKDGGDVCRESSKQKNKLCAIDSVSFISSKLELMSAGFMFMVSSYYLRLGQTAIGPELLHVWTWAQLGVHHIPNGLDCHQRLGHVQSRKSSYLDVTAVLLLLADPSKESPLTGAALFYRACMQPPDRALTAVICLPIAELLF